MWVGSPHKWSPWWGEGSPSYPLTLFKALPFILSQTAPLKLQQLCCRAYRSCAQGAGWCNMDGISLCSKNEIYIHHLLKMIPEAVRLYCILLLRQTGRIKAMGHMQTLKIIWLYQTGIGLLILGFLICYPSACLCPPLPSILLPLGIIKPDPTVCCILKRNDNNKQQTIAEFFYCSSWCL